MWAREALIRLLGGAIVVGLQGMAVAADAPASGSSGNYFIYLSKLPLSETDVDKRIVPRKESSFYCAGEETGPGDFRQVPDANAPKPKPTDVPPQIPACRNDRLLDGKGATVHVVFMAQVLVPREADATKQPDANANACPPDPGLKLDPDEADEVVRSTAISEGFQAAVKFALQKDGALAPKGLPPVAVYCYWSASRVLLKPRATLKLIATVPESIAPAPPATPNPDPAAPAADPKPPTAVAAAPVRPAAERQPPAQAKPTAPPAKAQAAPDAAPAAGATPAADAGPTETATFTLVTGAKEHLFLSGDAVVRGAKELKYDSSTKGVYERDKPDQLYLGINALVGDVYGHYDALSINRFAGKLLISPNKRPFDSVGLAIGYRFKDLTDSANGPVASGGLMLFVGHFWTKGDSAANDGGASDGKRTQSWRVGLSYSLDTLLGWLK